MTHAERPDGPAATPTVTAVGGSHEPLTVLCLTNMWPGPDAPDFGSFVSDMCDALRNRGAVVDVAAIDRRGGGPLRTPAKYGRLLADAVRRARRVDVIYAHYIFPTGAIAAIAGRLSGRPVVLTAHGQDVANLDRRALRRASARALRGAHAVIAVSDYLAQALERTEMAPQPIHVVNMGVDMDRFVPGDRAEARERLGIGGLGGRRIRELSGGQQQRVFLARAMIAEPDLLLLDEPTSGVDIRTRDEVLHLLADLNRQGMTIVLTTHELNSVAAHLPWVVCVNRRIVAEGDPDEVFTAPVLNATYDADLRIVGQDGHVLVADAAPHRVRDALRHRHDGYEHSHHEHDDVPHTHDPGPVA